MTFIGFVFIVAFVSIGIDAFATALLFQVNPVLGIACCMPIYFAAFILVGLFLLFLCGLRRMLM